MCPRVCVFRSSRCSHVAEDSDLLHTVCTVFSGTTCTHQPSGVVPWQERLVRGQEHHADSRAHGMSASVYSKQVRMRMKAFSVSRRVEMSQSQWAASSRLRFRQVSRPIKDQSRVEIQEYEAASSRNEQAEQQNGTDTTPQNCCKDFRAALKHWWLLNIPCVSLQLRQLAIVTLLGCSKLNFRFLSLNVKLLSKILPHLTPLYCYYSPPPGGDNDAMASLLRNSSNKPLIRRIKILFL